MSSKFKGGVYLALLTAAFSGIANFVNKFAVQGTDPLVHTALKNSLVAIFIISVLVIGKKYKQIKELNRRQIFQLFAIGVIGGSLPFYLFFTALKHMPAVNASLLHKTLVFWVALFAVPFLGEKISRLQVWSLLLIFAANFIIGGFKGLEFDVYELMVLTATVLWAIENVIAKIALRSLDPDLVVTARMGIGSSLLLAATFFQGKGSDLLVKDAGQLLLVLLTSLLLFGYVITWYRALQKAPVTLVATVLASATLITNLLSAIFVTHQFNQAQFLQLVMTLTGVWFFIIAARSLKKTTQWTQTSLCD